MYAVIQLLVNTYFYTNNLIKLCNPSNIITLNACDQVSLAPLVVLDQEDNLGHRVPEDLVVKLEDLENQDLRDPKDPEENLAYKELQGLVVTRVHLVDLVREDHLAQLVHLVSKAQKVHLVQREKEESQDPLDSKDCRDLLESQAHLDLEVNQVIEDHRESKDHVESLVT